MLQRITQTWNYGIVDLDIWGMDNISKLLNENMVEGMSSTKDADVSYVWEACVMGKLATPCATRVSIKQLNCSKLFAVMYVVQ